MNVHQVSNMAVIKLLKKSYSKEIKIMMNVVYIFVSTTVSWIIALMFIRIKRITVIYNSVIIGAVCAIAGYLLEPSGYEYVPVIIIIFTFMTLLIRIESRITNGNSIIVFFVAMGAESMLCYSKDSFSVAVNGVFGYGISFFIIIIFIVITFYLQKGFPESNWNEYFVDSQSGNRKLDIHEWYIYFVLAAQCLIFLVFLPMVHGVKLYEAISTVVAFVFLYWTTIVFVIIMIDYKREMLATLMEKQYRNEVQGFMSIIRSQRHDYNFHVQTLAGMINTDKFDACKKYLNELVKDCISMNTVLPVRDPAISVLINNFRIIAAGEGIELHIDIQNDMSNIATNAYETNKILSNLLQNAIDEMKLHKDKSYGIWLYILKRDEFCVIHVANEIREEISNEEYINNIYKHGYTTKSGHSGIGLSSIQALVKQYHGVIYTRIEGKVIHIIAKVPLKYL